jgi:hypothetical protein
MAKCDFCGSTVAFGGARSDDRRFCNAKCQGHAQIRDLCKTVPPEVVEREVESVYRGNCPKCGLVGPVDVHKYHEVWSLLVLTRWATSQQISCRSCATKRQLGALAFSLFCGWWGVPWGLIITPMQIARNLAGLLGGKDISGPSPALRQMVQVAIGQQMLAARRQPAAADLSQKPPRLPAVPAASA